MARGSIVKRKSGNWAIVYPLPDGRQKWETVGRRKKEAERVLNERMRDIHRGQYQELKAISFGDFASKWLSDYSEPRHKPNTHRFYRDIVLLHLVPCFGCLKLTSITPHMIEEYLAKKRKEGHLCPTTIGYTLRVLKTILKRALVWGYLLKNPAEHVEMPRAERKEMEILTVEELQLFLKTAKETEPEHYPFFLTAALTGMRLGELLALRWTDINWTNGQIHVRRSLSFGKFTEPKSRAAVRAIIVPPSLLSVLKRHKLSCTVSESDLVFPNEEGKALDPNNLRRRQFKRILRKAGLREIRIHDLRHTYASILIAQGENLKFIQSQLGHSSAQVTLDRYGHLMPQVQHGVGERLERTVFSTQSQVHISNPLAEGLSDTPELVATQ